MKYQTTSQPPPLVDFAALIAELCALGMTQTEIADHLQVTQGYVSQLATGKKTDPRWTVGARLVILRNKVSSRAMAGAA